MTGRDVTEPIVERLGSGLTSSVAYFNNDIAYDVAINGQPFFMGSSEQYPYRRETASYRRQQIDQTTEPGEQSLEGWWFRSQSSFHYGAGISYVEPLQGDSVKYRFKDSMGVNPFVPGQVTLLPSTTFAHTVNSNYGYLRSINYSGTDAVLLHDGHDVDRIQANGTVDHWIDYNSGTQEPVYAICDDGVTAYWLTNTTVSGTPKMHLYKRDLSAASSVTPTKLFDDNITISTATMEWVKNRIIACITGTNSSTGNPISAIYQLTPTSSSLGSPIYTHLNTSYTYTGITASGAAIYVSGYAGNQSNILKLALDANGTIPTLTNAVIAAELPAGELCYGIYYYLGRMMIGTNKGVRVAVVSENDGSITYGPLLFTSTTPVKQFAGRDRYVWCAATPNGYGGTIRVDLSRQIDNLVYPYANDSYNTSALGGTSYGVAFAGKSDRLVWSCGGGSQPGVYIESATVKMVSGYIQTGLSRFNTLEPKHFKFVKPRAESVLKGALDVSSIDKTGFEQALISIPEGSVPDYDIGIIDGASQEAMGMKFTLYRGTDTTKGAVLYGYQLKALPALRRARMLTIPLLVFDYEVDRYNVQVGHEGRAWERLAELESLDATGDVVSIQDFTNGELLQGVIEKVSFDRTTPPSKRFSGFGGIAYVQVRTVS